MPWVRGILFTVAVPGFAMLILPRLADSQAHRRGGWWDAGFVLVAGGIALYAACLLRFLAAGGTPLIFLAKRLKPIFGEEPAGLVETGPYRFCRNPMYLAVVLVVLGQAAIFGSVRIAFLGAMLWLFFHCVAVYVEEPHLRARHGERYEAYCRRVPRWPAGRPRRGPGATRRAGDGKAGR